MLTLASLVVAALIVHTAVSAEGRAAWAVIAGTRARHVRAATASAGVCAGLLWLFWQVPALRHGWWSMVGGDGTLVTGMSSGLPAWAAPAALTLIVVAIPAMAYTEELTFRAGVERLPRWGQAGAAAGFALVHLVVGIPLAAAFALIALGAVTTVTYLRALEHSAGDRQRAVAEATRVHAAHSYLLVVAVAVMYVAGG